MPIIYKIDVITALKDAGYNTNRIRKEKLLAESTLQSFRIGRLVSWKNMERICALLDCQPGDILSYISDEQA